MDNRTDRLLNMLAHQEKEEKQPVEWVDEKAEQYKTESELLEMMRDIRGMPGRDY